MKKVRGFTLLELIIVIIIIGILATLGFTQYTKLVEKGRIAEARAILGTIRSAQEVYKLEWGTYTGVMADLAVEAPTVCTATHYFRYNVAVLGDGAAVRCTTGEGGKSPGVPSIYIIIINYATGVITGTTPGYD